MDPDCLDDASFSVVDESLSGEVRPRFAYQARRPNSGAWPAVAVQLRQASGVLKAMPVLEIVEAIHETASQWLDPSWQTRRETRDAIAAATGFSPEGVDHSLNLEMRNYLKPSLMATLEREFGDPAVLDEFRPDPRLEGLTTARGPGLSLVYFTGNVPGLPALELVRCLLLKSAVIAKVASEEPLFAARFAATLADADARLGDALLISYWPRDDDDTLRQVVALVDAVIAYGGPAVCERLREVAPRDTRYIEHGHRVSYGIVSSDHLERAGVEAVAANIAHDFSAFDQHACIAPQGYLVEGDEAAAATLAAAVAEAMAALARTLPPGRVPEREAATVQLRRAAQGVAGSAHYAVWSGEGPSWTVVVDDRADDGYLTGNRFVRLVPIAALDEAAGQLAPYRGHLQNVALGMDRAQALRLAPALIELGASRLCAPGRMADPSLMWRHDGMACLASLVSWCDLEMHPDDGGAS